jgi:hypothetical protein
MKKPRSLRVAALVSAMVLSGGAVVLLPASAAMATQADCDANGVVGRFRAVESGASFDFRGRRVELQNESAIDVYSRAEIKSGRQNGDRLWVDRSFRTFSSHGIVSDANAKRDGWKMCGPWTTGTRTQSVRNDDYAARACAEIEGVTICGKWYVD